MQYREKKKKTLCEVSKNHNYTGENYHNVYMVGGDREKKV